MKTSSSFVITVTFVCLSLIFASRTAAAPPQILRDHVPAAVKFVMPTGNMPGTNQLQLAIALPLRNQAALSNLLHELYDPASPNFHHYLTPKQFSERFGPTEADYEAAAAFANANGLRVTMRHPNRVLLDVEGSAADVERALHVKLNNYRHPTENRTFYAPDSEPSLDLAVPILHISGLNNYSLPRPRYVTKPLASPQNESPNANTGSGPSGTFMGNDFRAAYASGVTLNGSGQIVGLLQFDGYSASDITYYENLAGLPNVPLQNVLIDGASGNPSGGGGAVEVSLDIEMAISMATNLSKVMVYIAPNPAPFVDLLSRMATDNLAKQLSCSWYMPNGTAEPAADVIFQEMAAQGQSFFNASGDDDAYTGLISFPGDTPYITQVGGTTLTTSGPGGTRVSETVWNWGNGIGSGGGISTQYPTPSWQTNISMTANQGSTTMRDTPDVALTADNVYVRAYGHNYNVGGTSCSAPLWAGFAALVNQQAVASGQPTVGFINPLVDAVGTGAAYTTAFHDITTGNNTRSGSPTKFYAVTGYDLCTGWGTPAGQGLIDALANPEPLIITPATGFVSAGGSGGPFTVTSEIFTLTNAGTNTLNWTLANASVWMDVTPASGTLAPGDPTATVTASLNAAASNLVVGVYTATVWFTNLNDNFGQGRPFTLNVVSPPTITTQPSDQAVLEGGTATFTAAATGGLPLAWQWQNNGTNLADGGNIAGSTTTNLVISNVSSNDLGAYTVVVTNVAGMAVSSNAFLTLTPSAPVIVMQPLNQSAIVGMTAMFTVGVIGTTPYVYQWSHAGTNLDGATKSSLSLTNVQFSDAGTYAVAITNVYGSTNSQTAVLTVTTCEPAPPDLVGWWPGEWNAHDIIGTNNGTLQGGASYTSGKVGQAFTFDGSGSYVNIPDSPLLDSFSNSITIELWLKANDTSDNSDWQGIVTKGNAAWAVQATTGARTVSFGMTGPSPNNGVTGSRNVKDGQWHHVAGVYDGTNIYLYVDGTLDVSTPATGNIVQNSYPMTIGCNGQGVFGSPGYFYNGSIDEVSLYHRALSASEIQAIYVTGSGGKCPPPPVPPTIIIQPVSQTNYVGTTASFSVVASGTPPLSYQWSTNGTAFIGATNSTLALTNVQLSQNGSYYSVLVSNAAGSTNSITVTLTVNPPPSCDPAPSGIVGWWPGAGNAYDIIGTNNGTLQGGASYTSGKVGQAFTFDGSGSYVNIPDSPLLDSFSNSITIELWLKANDTSDNSDWQGIVTKGNGAWAVQATTGATTVSFGMTGPSPSGVIGSRNVKDGQWHHVAGVYDGTNIYLYVDGTLDVSTPASGNIVQNSYPMTIGCNGQGVFGSPGYFYNGSIDEVSLYHRALSASEIQAIYVTGSGGKCPPPPVPPTIIIQPVSQTNYVGTTASFTVTATGTLPLNYQWNFNGTNIGGATNATLTLPNVQLTNAGNYVVAITNLYGSTNSQTAVLTVNPPPSCDPAPSGIVGWWPGEGNAYDIIGTNNGTLQGGASYTSGKVGQAFTFDGSSGYVNIPDSPLLDSFSNSITIELWLKANDTSDNSDWQGIVTKGNAAWEIQGTTGEKGVYFTGSGGLSTGLKSTRNVKDGQWHHVAGVYDGTNIYLYVDGTLDASTPASGNIVQNSYPMTIGCNGQGVFGSPGYFYNGSIDEVSLYHRALSASEIQAIYVTGSGGKCPPPPVPPTIIIQPVSQTNYVGTTASFTVTATGTLPLNYQWNFNGTNIGGATNATLTLPNVQLTNAGNYVVAITNLYGSTNSQTAVLTVNPPPSCDPAPSGIVGWWPGEGNAYDIIRTNNGTLQGGASYTSGKVGQAFTFDGSGSYVNIPDSPLLDSFSNSITVELWLKANDTSDNSDWQGIVTKGNAAWAVQATSGAKTVSFGMTGPSPSGVNGSRNVKDGQWHHVAGVYNGTNIYLYVDGTLDVSTPASGNIVQNSYPMTIGCNGQGVYGYPGYFYNGSIDEVSLYHRALSASEIQAIYATGSGGKCPLPPTILAQPTNQTVMAGATVIFSVKVNGSTPFFYQWSFNGTNLLSSTNSLLTLTNVQFTQAGVYAVQIANAAGSTNSANAILTVNSPPIITSQPTSQTNIVGTTASFIVVATGSTPLTYQWKKNGTNLVGQTSTNFAIVVVQTNDAATYSVAVTNAYGSAISSNTVLTVIAPPIITQQPLNRTNVAGTTATFTSGATGPLPSSYHWQKNGTLLADGGNVSGSATTNLSLSNVQDADAAGYAMVVTMPSVTGSITSSPAQLVVLDPPVITVQPTNQFVVAGSNAVLVVAASGTTPLAFQWSFNDTNLTDNPRINGSQSSLLIISNALIRNSGNYQVLVANSIGSATSSVAVLMVGVPPKIITGPASQSAPPGCSVSFSVLASGSQLLAEQWWKDGTPLDGQTNATLSLTNIQSSDLGDYSVVLTNWFGCVTSAPALLSFGYHPPVAGPDVIQRFANGGVRVSSADLLANDTDTNGDSLTIIDVSSNSVVGGMVGLTNNWVYYTPPAGWTHADEFTYTLSDGHCGTAVGTVSVQVTADNPQPAHFTIGALGNGSLQLTFSGIPGSQYQIQYAESLVNPDWQILTTQTADGFGQCQFSDMSLTNTSARYYRVVYVP